MSETKFPGGVRRVEDETITGQRYSKIEPPLSHTWDALTKLQWSAAVTNYDHPDAAVSVDFVKAFGTARMIREIFNVSTKHTVASTGDFESTWCYLNGLSAGLHEFISR